MDQTYMKEKPLFPLIVRMALPMVVSMLVLALYNIVDSYFVARISDDAMTALSLIYPLQNLISAVGIGFGVGINSVIAYSLGAGRQDDADRALTVGTLLSLIQGIAVAGICAAVASPFIRAFTDNEAVMGYGLDYFYIVAAFSPLLVMGTTVEKVLQSVGKMVSTMCCMAAGSVLNIVLDPVFINLWGVSGAAIATGLGQAVSLVCFVLVFFLSRLPVRFRLGAGSGGGVVRRMYTVGVPAFLNLALPSFMILGLNAILVSYSEVYVMILGIYYKLQTFIYFTAAGVIQGIRPLVSYNHGAGRRDRVNGIFRYTLLICLAIMLVGTVLCLAVPKALMGLYTEDPETLEEGAAALRIISCGFLVSGVSVVIAGMFEGLGKGAPSLAISLIRYILIIAVAFLTSLALGAEGVWHAFWITELVGCAVSVVLYVVTMRRLS